MFLPVGVLRGARVACELRGSALAIRVARIDARNKQESHDRRRSKAEGHFLYMPDACRDRRQRLTAPHKKSDLDQDSGTRRERADK